MSVTALQWTGSPTITGTMWLGFSITGRRASAIRRFTLPTRSLSLSALDLARFEVADRGQAPAAMAGASEVVKMKPGA